jgi:hypothetical protein
LLGVEDLAVRNHKGSKRSASAEGDFSEEIIVKSTLFFSFIGDPPLSFSRSGRCPKSDYD